MPSGYCEEVKPTLQSPGCGSGLSPGEPARLEEARTNLSYEALAGDGGRYGKPHPLGEAGMPPAECAEGTLEAMVKGKHEVLVGKGTPIIGTYVKRWSPSLFTRRVRKAQVI